MVQDDRGRETLLWLADVKEKALAMVEASPLTQGCAVGDMGSLRSLMIGFWAFVNAFPGIIESKYGAVGDDHRAAKTLAGMEADERSHRAKWIDTCRAIGIDEPQLVGQPLPLMHDLIDFVSEDTALHNTFLRFLGVEIIAETLSEALMRHEAFREALGKVGQEWFTAHLHRGGTASTAHERIAIHLAERHARESWSKELFAQEALGTVTLFIEAAAQCHARWATAGAR